MLQFMMRVSVLAADGTGSDAQSVSMSYPDGMDHLEVLREKIGSLRAEIAQLQQLNDRFWLRGENDTQAQIAHGLRHERLEAIQQELAQLAGLSGRVLSVEERKVEHRARLHVVKKAS
jgi:hypothetical protein